MNMKNKRTSSGKPHSKPGKITVKTVRLSATKTRKLEKDFRSTVNETRTDYLSEELNKYKNIEVSYD